MFDTRGLIIGLALAGTLCFMIIMAVCYIYREGIKMGLVKRNYEDEEWGDLSGEGDDEG